MMKKLMMTLFAALAGAFALPSWAAADYDDPIKVTNTYTAENPYTLTEGKTYTMAPLEYSSCLNGAVEVLEGGYLTGENVTFADNSTHYAASGGAIFNNGGTITLTNATFIGNSAPESSRGAIANFGPCTFNCSTTFKDNFALYTGAFGNGSTATFNGVANFINNRATNEGVCYGGALANWGTLTFNAGAVFNGNSVAQGVDGALYNAGTLAFAGTMDLQTSTDTWLNEGSVSGSTETYATINWDLTGGLAQYGTIKNFERYSNANEYVKQFITVKASGQETGAYVIASGDLSNLTDKDAFILTNGVASTNIMVGDPTVQFGDRLYTLKKDVAGDRLVLGVALPPKVAVEGVANTTATVYTNETVKLSGPSRHTRLN